MSKALKIIEALGRHSDSESVNVLEEIGTNSSLDEIREATAKALVSKKTSEALRIVISKKGKGVNDLNPKIAMSTINSLLELDDKSEVMQILDSTISENVDEEVRNTAKSLRALITLSN